MAESAASQTRPRCVHAAMQVMPTPKARRAWTWRVRRNRGTRRVRAGFDRHGTCARARAALVLFHPNRMRSRHYLPIPVHGPAVTKTDLALACLGRAHGVGHEARWVLVHYEAREHPARIHAP